MRKTPKTPLRRLRESRTLSQEQMASILGITQASYSKIESGKLTPSEDLQIQICTVLGGTRSVLFPWTEAVAP